ncbi:hypothetical protein T12_11757 [Trichinella patagoniensis]|uniref:Uncharacterized protein n=1 Tax=Trichinella patagoniensis TaxID=990121 RepID=A0A0V0ZTB2_9BILA|nr:hypothetical protein T12_11757 [Trichinella patagoniensis]
MDEFVFRSASLFDVCLELLLSNLRLVCSVVGINDIMQILIICIIFPIIELTNEQHFVVEMIKYMFRWCIYGRWSYLVLLWVQDEDVIIKNNKMDGTTEQIHSSGIYYIDN